MPIGNIYIIIFILPRKQLFHIIILKPHKQYSHNNIYIIIFNLPCGQYFHIIIFMPRRKSILGIPLSNPENNLFLGIPLSCPESNLFLGFVLSLPESNLFLGIILFCLEGNLFFILFFSPKANIYIIILRRHNIYKISHFHILHWIYVQQITKHSLSHML